MARSSHQFFLFCLFVNVCVHVTLSHIITCLQKIIGINNNTTTTQYRTRRPNRNVSHARANWWQSDESFSCEWLEGNIILNGEISCIHLCR